MKIQESAENYLEMILMLKERSGQVRSIDIAHELGYTKPSVSVAMKRLRENDYIAIDEDGYITLQTSGLEIATQVYERHQILSQLLMALGVSEETALKDACRIEHDISDESYQRLKEYFERHKGR
ncbi:metal-dependent transcriptional regulator [Desulfosporosinus sp. PR]|uniref:metal-dependent transcriptional regulator n=1 Tax=Candidatus Desulfosporosinus nitrosoreducens TaxID=3401928 RepID=UPI0027EC3EEE|nr:metal-dependent transcriptional regulator [Desulfosporosinus sp. PR]MDQ7091990.1 metal-dependent transcriptional regulator [Desulfosporosinus sp. PR]